MDVNIRDVLYLRASSNLHGKIINQLSEDVTSGNKVSLTITSCLSQLLDKGRRNSGWLSAEKTIKIFLVLSQQWFGNKEQYAVNFCLGKCRVEHVYKWKLNIQDFITTLNCHHFNKLVRRIMFHKHTVQQIKLTNYTSHYRPVVVLSCLLVFSLGTRFLTRAWCSLSAIAAVLCPPRYY